MSFVDLEPATRRMAALSGPSSSSPTTRPCSIA